MPSTKEIRTRIKSVKNTAQITKAMQLVAASKMKRAQDSALAGRHYSLLLAEIFNSLIHRSESLKHPFMTERPVRKRGILVISTDKGLCGGLNSNLFRKLITDIKTPAAFVAIGRKAVQFISRTQRELLADFQVSDQVPFYEVRVVVEFMVQSFIEGRIDTIEVLHQGFVNTLVQEPILKHLVPIRDMSEQLDALKRRLHLKLADAGDDEREMIFEPSAEAIMAELPQLFVKQQIYHSMLTAKASEHSARMVAMKAATDNAKKLTGDLTLEYNKARQAAITQEILELSAAGVA